jgi:hypothetical protein
MALALWLTHSRGAILGILLVGVVALIWQGRQLLWSRRVWALAGVTVLALAAVLIWQREWVAHGLTQSVQSSDKRTDYWLATGSMIADHPWLGVGPGNFGRYYPRYMRPAAFEKIQDPHNFLLEIWASAGIFALLASLVALWAIFRQCWSFLRRPWSQEPEQGMATGDLAFQPRWEFYGGAMVGLVLGFLLRAAGESPDTILLEGVISAGRSLIWFAVFTLLILIPWAGRSQVLALVMGIAALLINLLFSGGLMQPTVAQPLWVMAALALNACRTTAPDSTTLATVSPPRHLPLGTRYSVLGRWLPVPLLGALALIYLQFIFYPVTSGAAAMADARRHAAIWRTFKEPDLRLRLQAKTTMQEKNKAVSDAASYVKSYLVKPLERATEEEPGNSTPRLELAQWYAEEHRLLPVEKLGIGSKALQQIHQAKELDPDNKEIYWTEYELEKLLTASSPSRAREHAAQALKALQAAVELDPTEARLRYELARELYQLNDRVKGRKQAERAHELDQQATTADRQLTPPQREQIRRWLQVQSVSPPRQQGIPLLARRANP